MSGRRVVAVVAALALLLGGCGGPDAFEPAESRPCAFLTHEDLEKYALVVEIDEADRCVFGKKPMWEDTLTGLTVEYRAEGPAAVAAALRLAPVAGEEAEDTRITYRGSEKTDYREGVCRLVAPIGDDRTLLVEAGIDLTGVRWYYQKAVEEPCAYMAYKHGYPEMLAKLRS